jgi:ribonuclease BN (tRNA processing enzyme)
MTEDANALDVLFLGTGNAFAAEGRAFSSFLLNGRYLFDVGPTVLQQLKRAEVSTHDIDLVLVSHFHADHYFGLPLLLLDAWHRQREKEIVIAGPPEIEQRTEALLEVAFAALPGKLPFKRRYVEVEDNFQQELAGLQVRVAEVEHVPELRCFAYQATAGGRTLTYSGDSTLCEGLLRLVPGAHGLVLECSCGESVHMSPEDIDEVLRHASPDVKAMLTHLDGKLRPDDPRQALTATDLARYRI